VTINKTYIMHIVCSIYVLIAVSFLCTVLAQELGGDIYVKKLAKKVKKNIKNIRKLDTNLEDLNEEIADLGGKLNATTDDLNDLDEAVTGVEEKIEVFNGDLDEAVTGLEEKIKLLEEALEVARKVEEIQFFGVASQSTTLSDYVAMNCIDGSQSNDDYCHTVKGDADPWWKLSFTNDVVINRIMTYNTRSMKYTVGNRVSILSAAGTIVWEHTIEKEEKKVNVIAVPNIAGQYVKFDKPPRGYIIMREVVVFGRYD